MKGILVVQSLSHVQLFATPWTAARQASLSFSISWSVLKLMSIKSVMPSSHLILWCPLLLLPWSLLKSVTFPMSQLYASVQFTSVAQSCPTLCDPMDCSTPGFPVHHQLPELAQTHVHQVDDVTQPSHPLFSSSPPAFNLSQHQGLFKWVSSLHQVAKLLEFQLQHQSFQ